MIRSFATGRDGRLAKNVPIAEAARLAAGDARVWVDVENPSEGEFRALEDAFRFHPLALEDARNEKQRPKLDEYPDHHYIVLHYLEVEPKVASRQVNFFVGKNFLVSVHYKPIRAVDEALAAVERSPAVLEKGPDFMLYSVIDKLVDGLFPLFERLEARISAAEDAIFFSSGELKAPDKRVFKQLFGLKKELLTLRKAVWPQREVLHALVSRELPYVHAGTLPYLRDVYDHLIRVIDLIDTFRELITSAMEGYLSLVSNELNVVMKRLTSITLILLLPALISGVYGMNFLAIPRAEEPGGFFEVVGLMLVLMGVSYVLLKKRGWF